MTQAPKEKSLWRDRSSVPEFLETIHFVLEPLHEKHAELDYQALMSCRLRLREELQWGDWPPEGFTLEQNRVDLRDHYQEFVRGEAFAYTVLTTDRQQCLGCIYLERCPEIDGAQLAFWVVNDAIDVEVNLVAEVLQWVHTTWSISCVLLPLRPANSRGLNLVRSRGCVERGSVSDDPLAGYHCYLSETQSQDLEE